MRRGRPNLQCGVRQDLSLDSPAGGAVLISNGHGKFHLIYAAQGAQELGLLEKLITAAYPKALLRRVVTRLPFLSTSLRIARFLTRRVDGVDDDRIVTCSSSEVLYQLAAAASRLPLRDSVAAWLHGMALVAYQRAARRQVRQSSAKIYHVRGGYGGSSILEGRTKGMTIVVDHSVAEPHALIQLIRSDGEYTPGLRPPLPLMWRLVQQDVELADLLLVNSDFVKRTLTDFGVDPRKIVVLYLGVDSEMETYLRGHPTDRCSPADEVRFLFVGTVGKRKGADVLLQAFRRIKTEQWRLTLAGPIERNLAPMIGSVRNPRINVLGPVLRSEVARLMLSHHVLVFPSLAEGSARVVFEAMAAGMAVITTPNAGSVMRDRIHGILVEPGSIESVMEAVQLLLGSERDHIGVYGEAAKTLIQREYHSGTYKAKLTALYRDLVTEGLQSTSHRGAYPSIAGIRSSGGGEPAPSDQTLSE